MEVVCLDTDILIEYWRTKQHAKSRTRLYKFASTYQFAVSAITAYELLRGDNSTEDTFWKGFFAQVRLLDFDLECAIIAGEIYRYLKTSGTLIGVEDILIAATVLKHGMMLASNNTRHFARIKGLLII